MLPALPSQLGSPDDCAIVGQHLRLEPKPTKQLAAFALSHIYRVNSHVRSITIDKWYRSVNFHPYKGRHGPSKTVQDYLDYLDNVLGLSGWPAPDRPALNWSERAARIQNALLARILHACTELHTVEIVGSLAIVTGSEDEVERVSETTVPNRVYPALKNGGKSVTKVSITLSTNKFGDFHPVGEMTRLVLFFPECRQLDLHLRGKVVKRWNSKNRPRLMRAIVVLEKLEELDTRGWTAWDEIVHDESVSLPGTVRSLRIEDGLISLGGLALLGKRYGKQLVNLDIDNLLESSGFDLDSASLDTVRLETVEELTLEGFLTRNVLAAFAASPLRAVKLTFEAGTHHPRPVFFPIIFIEISPPATLKVTPRDILQFLAHHKPTLEHVSIFPDSEIGDLVMDEPEMEAWEEVTAWCRRNNVRGGLYEGLDDRVGQVPLVRRCSSVPSHVLEGYRRGVEAIHGT